MWRNEHYAILDRIQPNVMYAYLTSRGWKKEETYGENADFFALQQDRPRVLIPASPAIPDYGLSVWRILDTLSKIEERDSLEILRDLHLADFDQIRVGYGENREDDAMPVDRGASSDPTITQPALKRPLARQCTPNPSLRLAQKRKLPNISAPFSWVQSGIALS